MSDLLYPTELASHPQPGSLASFRDGVFGRRGSAPYGQSDSAFENGVFGPGLGRGLRGLRGHDAAPLDSGPHGAYRDGIFNFPRQLQTTPHPVNSYQDGIFGGASLGATAEAPTPADSGAAAASDGGGVVAPVLVVLDLTSPAVVTEVVHFLIEGAAALGYDTGSVPYVDKASWDRDCSNLLAGLVEQAAAANPTDAAAIRQYGVRRVGDLVCPTGAFLYMYAASAASAGFVMDPGAYPALSAYLTSCAVNMFAGPAPATLEEAALNTEVACPIKYPKPRFTRAAVVGGAVVAGGLLYLLLRK